MKTQYNDPKGTAGAVKVPLGLIPPHAMEQTAWVHKLGADKYGPWNWRETGVCASTYVNAILRHLNAWRDGEDLDPESGISHLAHVACSANILMDAEYCDKLQDDRNRAQKHVGGGISYEEDWGALDEEEEDPRAKLLKAFFKLDKYDEAGVEDDWAIAGYRILKEGEILRDGDEVYVGSGDWLTLYIPHWIEQQVHDGTYRRKLITNCDLKERQSCPECDALASYGTNDGPCDYHKSTEVADCDLKEECKCGRHYVYHWLYGWICEDCDLKLSDYYP